MIERIKYEVYMLGAISSRDGLKTAYLRAIMGDTIKGLGHRLLTPHVAYDFETTIFRQRVGGWEGISHENEKLMDQATLFIAEGSGASDDRGYEISYALKREIPVLVFRHISWGRGSAMIFGKKHPLLYTALYDVNTLESLMVDAIDKVPQMKKDFVSLKLSI